MTKITTLAALIAMGIAGTAIAMSDNAKAVDVNGDGILTIDELQAVFPEVTTDSFSTLDLNADGALDDAEITAAEDAGIMPTGPSDS